MSKQANLDKCKIEIEIKNNKRIFVRPFVLAQSSEENRPSLISENTGSVCVHITRYMKISGRYITEESILYLWMEHLFLGFRTSIEKPKPKPLYEDFVFPSVRPSR